MLGFLSEPATTVARWTVDELDAALAQMDPEDALAPVAAYLDVHSGQTARGMALSLALRDQPLEITAESAVRVCDLALHRLWSSRLEFRADPQARQAATDLLASEHPLGPYRRCLLHYALGAEVLVRVPLTHLAELDGASEHLERALALGRSLEAPGFVARCQSMLALLEVPRGNLTVAEALSRDALTFTDPESAYVDPLPFWRMRALLVLQWTGHYQGRQIDTDVLAACAARPLLHADPILSTVLATVTALAALESGDVAAARRALNQSTADRRINGLGLWRLPLLVIDGYLSVVRDDELQAQRVIADLIALPAPAEAALVRSIRLSQTGRLSDALTAIAPVTSGDLQTPRFTYTIAATLEAALFEELGKTREADRSMARALGAAEPINALRLFTQQGPAHLRTLATRAVAAAPTNSWIAAVAAYLDGVSTAPDDLAHEQPVRTDLTAPGGEAGSLGPADRHPADGSSSPLTPRELEVLRLVNEGASHAQISTELFVSLNTVKTHLRSIRRKLGVERTGEAAAFARRAGWL